MNDEITFGHLHPYPLKVFTALTLRYVDGPSLVAEGDEWHVEWLWDSCRDQACTGSPAYPEWAGAPPSWPLDDD